MTPEKILEVVRMYRSRFVAMNVEPRDYPHEELVIFKQGEDPLAHCCGMLPKMEIFIHEGRIEKAMRWLGFVQGCLWMSGVYSLDDLMSHRRPDESEG
ncbi:MAG: hypothetical protein V4682_03290 [Patescibacteria group bacterium]